MDQETAPVCSEQDPAHRCTCQSTLRRLIVAAADEAVPLHEVAVAAETFGWTMHPELDAVEIPVGPGARMGTISEAVAILKSCTGPHFPALNAVWLGPTDALADSMRLLLKAKPLADFAAPGEQDSPLAEILESGTIRTWFQPVFTTGSLELWGYECLMRAEHAGELIFPDKLLAWAKTEGLIFTLDRVCRESHLKNAASADLPGHCRFLINFLPSVIYDPEVCLRSTMRAAKEAGIAPARVIFEVVETEAVEDPVFLRRILDRYRDWGFGVALDDVGAGHSGLTMLADLEPDLIKIDRGLVSRAPTSLAHRNICEALVKLGHGMNKKVLAEGVETDAEWALVQALGADLVQGFMFGKPQPEPALRPL